MFCSTLNVISHDIFSNWLINFRVSSMRPTLGLVSFCRGYLSTLNTPLSWNIPSQYRSNCNSLSSPLRNSIIHRLYSDTKRPRRVRQPSIIWVHKQAEKRQWKLERRRDTQVNLPDNCSSKSLAASLGVRTIDVLKILIKMNECPANSEVFLPEELVDLVSLEFGRFPVRGRNTKTEIYPRDHPTDLSKFPTRSPIVSIMGHIDHGKTTLLDALKGTNITKSEHGGITQRLAAFPLHVKNFPLPITVIDTPGHSAFMRMRQRGAKFTDIAILMVAADSGVQEQTQQSIRFIEESECPMIVAINKCDRPNADPAKVRQQLASNGVALSCFGGDVHTVEISALKKTGLEDLVDVIMLLAEELDLRVDATGFAEANILDVRKDEHRGIVADCILNLGQLKKGHVIIAGHGYGHVKMVLDENNQVIQKVENIKPGQSFSVTGWEVEPHPGDQLIASDDAKKVKNTAVHRKIRTQNHESSASYHLKQRLELKERELEQKDKIQAVELGLDPLKFIKRQKTLRESFQVKEIPLLIKADTYSVIEAIKDSLLSIPDNEVKIQIVRASVGQISEQEILGATFVEPKMAIVAFNVDVPEKLRLLAEKNGVPINSFKIIYPLIEWVRDILSKHLKPKENIRILASVEVIQLFIIKSRKADTVVAGCRVTLGTFKRRICQIVRNGKVISERPVRSLRHVKSEVKEIALGKECGISFGADFTDIQIGDVINNIERKFVTRSLDESRAEHEKKVKQHLLGDQEESNNGLQ